MPAGVVDGADSRVGLVGEAGGQVRIDRCEAGEVVFPDNLAGCPLGEFEVEVPRAVPTVGSYLWWADSIRLGAEGRNTGKDAVLIGLADSAVAGVEPHRCVLRREDTNCWRQRAVECAEQTGGWDGGGELTACYLTVGVDPRVGAARALRQDGFAGDLADRCGERALNRREGWLDLPTVEVGAVVREDEFPDRHRFLESITKSKEFAASGQETGPESVAVGIVECKANLRSKRRGFTEQVRL